MKKKNGTDVGRGGRGVKKELMHQDAPSAFLLFTMSIGSKGFGDSKGVNEWGAM